MIVVRWRCPIHGERPTHLLLLAELDDRPRCAEMMLRGLPCELPVERVRPDEPLLGLQLAGEPHA